MTPEQLMALARERCILSPSDKTRLNDRQLIELHALGQPLSASDRTNLSANQLLVLARCGESLTPSERTRLTPNELIELHALGQHLSASDRTNLSGNQLLELARRGESLTASERTRLTANELIDLHRQGRKALAPEVKHQGNIPSVAAELLGKGTMKFDVFLSHNSHDKTAVRDLKQRLVGYQLTVWFDEDELRPGIPWQKLLEEGIKTSASVAVLVGKDGLGPWEDEEMNGALRLAVKDKRPVIPVLMPGAPDQPELPMFLGNRTWVDLRNGFNAESIGMLVWGITGNKPNP